MTNRRVQAAFRAFAVCLLITSLDNSAHAQTAKDTPFGTELVAANFPHSTVTDVIDTLTLSAAIGGHSCFTWHWGDPNSPRSAVVTLPGVLRQYGLKSVIQFGASFLGTPAPPQGYAASFADPQTRARFLDDVSVVAAAHPDYLVLMTEADLMHRFNPAEFENFRTLYTEAYHAVKAVSPNTKVGVSFLYSLWYFNYVINNVDVPAMLAPSDFFAFTTYPYWLVQEGHYASIADIPAEFHGRARTAYPDASIVFSEVGWASKGRGTPELQLEFVRNLPRLMSTVKPELVTWALLHDVEFFQRSLLSPEATQFLTDLGVDIDAMFEHFNGMGLLKGDGTPKPALVEAMELDFSAP